MNLLSKLKRLWGRQAGAVPSHPWPADPVASKPGVIVTNPEAIANVLQSKSTPDKPKGHVIAKRPDKYRSRNRHGHKGRIVKTMPGQLRRMKRAQERGGDDE